MAIKEVQTNPHCILRYCKAQKKMINYDECSRCKLECKNPEGKKLHKAHPFGIKIK